MRILQLIKDWIPLLVIAGIAALILAEPAVDFGGTRLPQQLLQITWFVLGLILGAWLFRAYYKGGPEHLNRRALNRHNEAVIRTREYLAGNDPDRARFVAAPFIRATEVSEIHLLYAQSLVASGKNGNCHDFLVEHNGGISKLPLERLRLWESVFSQAGATDAYMHLLAQRFTSSPDGYIVRRLSEYHIANSNFDLLLEWASPWLRSSAMPELVIQRLRTAVMRSVFEIVSAQLRLDLVGEAKALLDEYADLFRTESIWYKLYSQTQARSGSVDASIETSLNGYRLTADPSLLLDAFSSLVLSTEPGSALATFVEGGERFPDDGMYAYFVGWVLYRTGLMDAARPHLYRALKRQGAHRFFAYITLTHLLHDSNDKAAAAELLNKGTDWIDRFPFLWECKNCGEVSNEPVALCSRCLAWNQQTIITLPTPEPEQGVLR